MLQAIKAAREEIVRQVRASWCPGDNDPISVGRFRVDPERFPACAIVTVPEVQRDYEHGVRSVREIFALVIEGRFAIPSDGTIDDLQVDLAHELGIRLVGDLDNAAVADWASCGCYWPKITTIEVPAAEPDRNWFSVGLALELSSDVLQ